LARTPSSVHRSAKTLSTNRSYCRAMCLAVPAEVTSIDGNTAKVDFGGVMRPVNISLVNAKIGDYVIVHAGYAIEVLDREEAEKTLQLFRELLSQEDAGA
jgi:hydrogenase expression/formation protein HypC